MTLRDRSFGVLTPVFSLPGTGTLDAAPAFLDYLASLGASIWQVLPLGPTHEDLSPYLSLSAHAGNPRLIGPNLLCDRVGTAVRDLRHAYELSGAADIDSGAFREFRARNRSWLDDYALYVAIRRESGDLPWHEWPTPLRTRDPGALDQARARLAEQLKYVAWEQFVFFEQWQSVRQASASRGIRLFGDVPIYVSHDSADVWQHQDLFLLDERGLASDVAGVPPDYFSPTGQRWGNPLYDWNRLSANGYRWWIERMTTQQAMFDIVRIDHFRALESYWSIPSSSPTAKQGHWLPGPGDRFLSALTRALPELDLVAEDLGTITREVDELRRRFSLPGIRVLQFGFDGVRDNPHSPANLEPNIVLYTGTHDNDTSLNWYSALPDWQRARVDEELSRYDRPFPLSLIECALDSVANTVIVPIQDLLGLSGEARVNTPGTVTGNWRWQLPEDYPVRTPAPTLIDLVRRYHREAPGTPE